MIRLLRRIRYWLQRDRMDAELAEEMEFHRAMLGDGWDERTAMGNTTLARENARGVWIWPWLESLWQDAAYAIRTMRRQPGFTITALLALGSAIGINTSLFTVFNAFALRSWTVRDPAHVVAVYGLRREGPGGLGIAQYRYLQRHSKAFTGLIAMRNGEGVKLDDRPEQLTFVSGNYFRALGIDMERGRGFLDEEDRTGAPQAVVVISHNLWQDEFGGDPRIVGRSIRLDDIPFTVVGVTPSDFTGTNPLRNGIWTPLPARELLRPDDSSVGAWLTSPRFCCTAVAGRLGPGVTRAQAQAELAVLLDQFQTENRMDGRAPGVFLTGTSWMDSPRKKRQVLPMILILFLAVTLVLLLACANVGNLLLARAAARRQEIAVRLSLGGCRPRIIRQLLVESMLLAFAAAGIGLAMAVVVPSAILQHVGEDQIFHVAPDLNVLAYTAAVAILSCLAFGLAPALHGTRGGISGALKAGADPEAAPRARLPLRNVLLSVQVAISVILLANAGMLVRGMQRAQRLDPGFDVQNVTVLSIDLPASQYTGPRTKALTRDLLSQLDRARDLPICGLALNPPLSNATYSTSFQVIERKDSPMLHIFSNEVSGSYFDALRMRVLAGRNFAPEDMGRDVVMINEAAAQRWWPGEHPVGTSILSNGKVREIVGVVSDTYFNDLSSIEAVIYFPIAGGSGAPSVIVHDRGIVSVDRITAIVKQIEPRAHVRAEPLAASFRRKLQPSIYGAEFAGCLGLLALAIASVGMCGVFAYGVGQRTREIGIRIALGAKSSQIVGLVLGSSFGAFGCGLAAGIAGATGTSALLAHVLPGIDPLDPLAYCNVVLLLSAAVALASGVPARRATQVDPVRALRWE
jgi:predicted permease